MTMNNEPNLSDSERRRQWHRRRANALHTMGGTNIASLVTLIGIAIWWFNTETKPADAINAFRVYVPVTVTAAVASLVAYGSSTNKLLEKTLDLLHCLRPAWSKTASRHDKVVETRGKTWALASVARKA